MLRGVPVHVPSPGSPQRNLPGWARYVRPQPVQAAELRSAHLTVPAQNGTAVSSKRVLGKKRRRWLISVVSPPMPFPPRRARVAFRWVRIRHRKSARVA